MSKPSKPNFTKSQLPMVRSLKAIARRKMGEPITFSKDQQEEFKRNSDRYEEIVAKTTARYIRHMPASQMRVVLLSKVSKVKLDEAQRKVLENYRENMDGIRKHAASQVGPIHSWSWGQEERARRQALFNELEALELDIISGETVDLAPYAKRLMPS